MKRVEVDYIETDVPIPVHRHSSLPVDLNALDVKESAVFSLEDRARMQRKASYLKARTDKEFTIRKINSEQCRVWRLK